LTFRILVQPPAEEDAADAYLYIHERAPLAADEWLKGLRSALESLSALPERCPLAPENDVFDEEIRQLIYGSYRILFTILDDTVRVLHVRHAARRWLEP
jgi:plasmid stabilization system protein ParE